MFWSSHNLFFALSTTKFEVSTVEARLAHTIFNARCIIRRAEQHTNGERNAVHSVVHHGYQPVQRETYTAPYIHLLSAIGMFPKDLLPAKLRLFVRHR